jgi:hypothetical protein
MSAGNQYILRQPYAAKPAFAELANKLVLVIKRKKRKLHDLRSVVSYQLGVDQFSDSLCTYWSDHVAYDFVFSGVTRVPIGDRPMQCLRMRTKQ